MENGRLIFTLIIILKNVFFPLLSLDVPDPGAPNAMTISCSGGTNFAAWIWIPTDSTVRNRHYGQCLTVRQELEVWAGPLSDGSQAVLLLNRADSGSEQITVKWSDIGLSSDHSANVRDLWAHKDLGTFTGNYTSSPIDHHAVMMFKITPKTSTKTNN